MWSGASSRFRIQGGACVYVSDVERVFHSELLLYRLETDADYLETVNHSLTLPTACLSEPRFTYHLRRWMRP
jgi:hypothetical protein